MNSFCQMWLTCEDKKEAHKIAEVLLNKHLVACAKQFPVSSAFSWKGSVERRDEVLLIMDSRENLFTDIEIEVARLHSYDTFVLQAVPVSKLSEKAKTWLNESLES